MSEMHNDQNSGGFETMIFAPCGGGKSVLSRLLREQGVAHVAGPVHIDGPAAFDEAAGVAHDIEAWHAHITNRGL